MKEDLIELLKGELVARLELRGELLKLINKVPRLDAGLIINELDDILDTNDKSIARLKYHLNRLEGC